MNHLLATSRPPIQAVGGKAGLTILASTDTRMKILSASREPVKRFQSPFLGKTLEEIYAIFTGSSPGFDRSGPENWSSHVFVVLDKATLSDPPTALVASDMSGTLETIRCDLPTTLRLAYCLDGDQMNLPYARARIVDADGIVTHEAWESCFSRDEELVEIQVDQHGERWFELVDTTGKRLGVVKKVSEVVGKFSSWRSKDTIEGGLNLPANKIPKGVYENDVNVIGGEEELAKRME